VTSPTWRGHPAVDLQLEYPVAGSWSDGQLASGYIDLVAVENGRVDIIDFKTDNSPTRPVEQTYPKYAAQVRIYGKLIETAGILKDRHLRCGLLFTADGSIRWIDL
jgi:ATP-dependent exoDNAse (exonuclease V) beta subunit